MFLKPFIWMVACACLAFSAACNAGNAAEDSATRTEVDLLITDPDTPPEEILLLIDFVSYRIACPASGLTPYDDSIDLAGYLEVDADAVPPVWEMATDLPLSPAAPVGSGCTISLWVFYEDEVVCSGSESIPIVEDSDPSVTNEVNVVLECNLSVRTPSADLDIDGSFDFIHGNYCPKLNWLGALPPVVEAAVPPVTTIETIAFDVDSTCGLNCDPQTCDFTQIPPLCTPAPEPAFTTTLFAPAGHGSFDVPVATGTPVTGGTPIDAQATFTCDPLFPGPTEICAVASDGDNDCDQMRCITIVCPDLCEGVVCDDGQECTRDLCDPLTGLCSNDPAPDGVACNDCNNTCVSGVCNGPDWVGAISGTDISFAGSAPTTPLIDLTLVNPYDDDISAQLTGQFNVNQSSYEGIGTDDVLTGTNLGDFLLVQDPVGTQRICGVETILAQNNFDAFVLADDFIVLGDMVIEGGNASDWLWANAGDDTLRGNNGVDWLDGGPGNDIVEGGTGDDRITIWPGSGFDSISGGLNTDTVEIDAIESQILITPAADPAYELDISYLGTPMAQIREVELIVIGGVTIDVATCTGSAGDVCNLCGNDALNGVEECDDGNNVDGDGCAADCTAEY